MLIFEEHFQDNRNNWATRDTDECYLCVDSNHYIFEHKRPGNFWWLTWQSSEFFYDKKEFRIHVILEKIAGESNHGYGFVWGLSDTKNFFEFVISHTGYYRIAKYDDGNFKDIVAWKRCSEIHKPNIVNVLEIRRQDTNIEFYINSELQEKLPAETLTQVKDGKFGFVIYDKMKIKVHSLIISAENITTNSYKTNSSRNDAATQASFFKHEPPVDDTLEKVFADLNALIGLERTKQQFFSLANFLKVQTERKKRGLKTAESTLHLVLYGSPGTGKTTVARLVGRLYKQLGCLQQGHVVETDRAGIIGGYIGQTALRVADAVDNALEGVLFIDEAYALVPKGGSSNDFGHEAVQALLKRMEDHRNELAVIVAGYPEEMEYFIASNPGLQSRFSRLFYFEDYMPSELVLIFGKFCYDHGYTMDIAARIALQKIFETAYAKRDKNFGNGRFVRTIFERSIEKQANRIASSMKDMDDSEISLLVAEDLEVSYV
jgi:SpoVK/Ycf46/Vps4 family AAA+-type ATPase